MKQQQTKNIISVTVLICLLLTVNCLLLTNSAFAEIKEVAVKSSYDVVGQKLGNYTLIDQDGNKFNTKDFAGKPVVLSLVYLGCGHACSTITLQLNNALNVAGKDLGTKFRAVTVSFDPEHDTPKKLKDFGKNFTDDFRQWRFATSDKKTIENLSKNLGFYYEKLATGYDHINMVTIIDTQGRIYKQVYGLDFKPEDILNPVYQAMKLIKAPQSTQLSVMDKLKLFCYKYDESSGQYKLNYGLIVTLSIGSILQAATIIWIIIYVWGKGKKSKGIRQEFIEVFKPKEPPSIL